MLGGDGRAAVVARDDVAAVAAALLTVDGHDGATYDVTGREALTFAEMAAAVGATYKDETIEEAWASRAGYGAPDWLLEGWISTYTAVARGELDTISDSVARLTDHAPITLAEFIRAGDRPSRA